MGGKVYKSWCRLSICFAFDSKNSRSKQQVYQCTLVFKGQETQENSELVLTTTSLRLLCLGTRVTWLFSLKSQACSHTGILRNDCVNQKLNYARLITLSQFGTSWGFIPFSDTLLQTRIMTSGNHSSVRGSHSETLSSPDF